MKAVPHFAWVCLAVACAGCSEDLEVLSQRSLVDASTNDANPPDALDDGTVDADGSDAGCAGRLGPDEPCTRSDECCSGVCALDPTSKLSCRPATGCASLGEACGRAGACCSLGCGGAGLCGTAVCASAGETCAANSDCCSDFCENELCAPTGASCLPAGERCSEPQDCCSDDCVEGPNAELRCGLLQACRVYGETCETDSDCCSTRCQVLGDHGYCDVLAECTSSDGKKCKAEVGEICKDDAACCSRSCQKTGQGAKRCAPSGACRAQCESCTQDAECCSGTCLLGADGARRCSPASVCLPAGEVCDTDDQCCGSSPKPRCYEDPSGLGAKRCHDAPAGSPCAEDGTSCQLASQCCGTFCSFESAALVCSSQCRQDGESCTIRTDCCGQFSDCSSIGGTRICAPVVE